MEAPEWRSRMILIDDDIIFKLAKFGHIEPFKGSNVQPASYDVTLMNTIKKRQPFHYEDGSTESIDRLMRNGVYYDGLTHELHNGNMIEERFDKYWLKPGEFILGSTNEYIKLPANLAARFEGKSSLGRIGLTTHITAGFIDPGFEGTITLEIKNDNDVPILLHADQPIGQLCFYALTGVPHDAYDKKGHYNKQTGPTEAK